MILGTAAYMSPEQARGRVVDKRADIWAFGAIVYEMLTATQAFAGESITDVLAHIVGGVVPGIDVVQLMSSPVDLDAGRQLRGTRLAPEADPRPRRPKSQLHIEMYMLRAVRHGLQTHQRGAALTG